MATAWRAAAYNPKLFGPTLYATLQEVKRTFDPDNLLNPGKVVDAPPLTENLRYGADYTRPSNWRPSSIGARTAALRPAIEMCNGAGVCRKLGAGTMCPSFMATKDEHDTTRARANALRNALAGRIPREELFRRGDVWRDGPVPGLQGVQERMPLRRGHGEDQGRVSGPLLPCTTGCRSSTA